MAIDMRRPPPPGEEKQRGPVVLALMKTVKPLWKVALLAGLAGLSYVLLDLYGALFTVVIFFGCQLGYFAWEAREIREGGKPRGPNSRLRAIKPVIRFKSREEDL